ncbi:hypothetical protein H6776_01605 [Candidatus Nomurabacteria bacterium]|nr:hypothetical protein [Candidatus Nomurabacteria bacterium]
MTDQETKDKKWKVLIPSVATLFLAGALRIISFSVPMRECPSNVFCINYFDTTTFTFIGFALLFFIFSLILFFIAKLVKIKSLVIVLIAFILSAVPAVCFYVLAFA